MKYAIVLILGIAIGYFLQPSPAPVETKLAPEDQTKFQKLIDNEAKNFALQKDADAKLKAAEELYGKMMVLFLANLSLKSNHEFVPADEPKIVEEPKRVEKEKVEVAKAETEVILPKETPVVSTAEPETKTKKKAADKTPQQIYDEFRSAHYVETFKAKQRRLLGHFTGILKRTKPRYSEDTIRFEFNLVQRGNNLTGDTLVTMTDETGKEYSRNAGNGGNRALKVNPNEADSYYVDASPTSFFIVSFKRFPLINGAYYEKGEFVGNVLMRKISGDM